MHDAHVHIHDTKLIDIMKKNGIPAIANAQNTSQYEFLSSFPSLKISAGLHPWDAETVSFSEIEPLLKKADLIGEIGMDNEWTQADLTIQKRMFVKQLAVAKKLHKPVILHTKGMEKEITEILKKYKNTYIVHWYSCKDYLQDFIDLDCYFTIGPSVCKDEAVRQVATNVSLSRMLLETDGLSALEWCEDHAVNPEDYPFYLKRTISEISKIRKMDEEVLEKILDKNFNTVIQY